MIGGFPASGAVPTSRPGVAAFDFDGTLVPGDSLGPFLTRLLGRSEFGEVLVRSGPAMLARYRAEGRDGAKAVLLARALAGVDGARVEAEGWHYGRELARRVRPVMADRIAWHRCAGHRLILVSASLLCYLGPFGDLAGFDQVIATRLEVDDDRRLTGRLEGANVRAAEKARLLHQALGVMGHPHPEVWAYGDSVGDRELLAMADHPLLLGGRRPWRGDGGPLGRRDGGRGAR